jgi:DNA-3-methyladenine glycosylase II
MPFTAQHIKSARLHLQKSDPVMKRLLKEIGPFIPKAHPDRFATLVNSIISQQISTSAARTIRKRLFAAVEARAIHTRQLTDSVNPANLLLFEIDDLREIGVSKQKATYILDLADKTLSETVNLKTIGRKSDEDVITELTQVKGIGRWTAQMFLMFSLSRLDVLPVDDLGIKNAVQKHYGLAELPVAKVIEGIAVPWRPYATIASWYLWRSMETA